MRHADSRRIWRTLRDSFPSPYTPEEARRWIRLVAGQEPPTEFAIALPETDEAVGGIGFIPQTDVHRRSAEVGYWLGEAHWGRGIMTAAVRALTTHAFARHDLIRLYAMVFSSNPASMRVLEKAGWTREGVLRHHVTKEGHTLDVVLYATVR